MKVCFFGTYTDPNWYKFSSNKDWYNSLLLDVLKNEKITILECRVNVNGILSLIASYFKLFSKHKGMNYDIMIIGWRGIMALPLAKLISRKPIVFFPFISIFQTLVEDRKIISKSSLKAKFFHFIDKLGCQLSDMIILDTSENIEYFSKEFSQDRKKFRRLMFGIDEKSFPALPLKEPDEIFDVLFIGTYIPLHGIDVIVESAKILSEHKDIKFTLVGDGQTKQEIESKIKEYNLNNIQLRNSVPQDKLSEILDKTDISLGIFSDSKKALSVVPSKLLISLCSCKPIITIDNPSVKEIGLENRKNCILIKPNNPKELSDAILYLKNNPIVMKEISMKAHEYYKKELSIDNVGKKLSVYLNELIMN